MTILVNAYVYIGGTYYKRILVVVINKINNVKENKIKITCTTKNNWKICGLFAIYL